VKPTITFLIPVKKFSRAKTRLAKVFPEDSREDIRKKICMALLMDILQTLNIFQEECDDCEVHVVISSQEPYLETLLANFNKNFIFLNESVLDFKLFESRGFFGLDAVIEFMNQFSITKLKASGSILLMMDLPLLKANNLHHIVNKGLALYKRFGWGLVISPANGLGCNMIARFPPDCSKTGYTTLERTPSFIKNLELARSTAIENGHHVDDVIHVYNCLEMYLDLDTADDLAVIFPLLSLSKPESNLYQTLEGLQLEIKKCSGDSRNLNLKMNSNRSK